MEQGAGTSCAHGGSARSSGSCSPCRGCRRLLELGLGSPAPFSSLRPGSSSMALRDSPKRKVSPCFLAEEMRYCSRSKLLRFFRGSVCSSQMRIPCWHYTGQKDLGKVFSLEPLQGLCIFFYKHFLCSPALFHRSHLTSFVHITSSFQFENPFLAADASL